MVRHRSFKRQYRSILYTELYRIIFEGVSRSVKPEVAITLWSDQGRFLSEVAISLLSDQGRFLSEVAISLLSD
jgi:hypothetical protein